jgi:hypothetical protein
MRRVLLFATLLVAPMASSSTIPTSETQRVAAVLDDWYDAAEKGDAPRYFSHFTDDAVFLGTDPGERWTISEFRMRYPHPQWTYVSKERHVLFSSDRKSGWFDEKVVSPKYGELRATGVVVRSRGTWKIAQYSLTFPIPNAAAQEVIDVLKRLGPESATGRYELLNYPPVAEQLLSDRFGHSVPASTRGTELLGNGAASDSIPSVARRIGFIVIGFGVNHQSGAAVGEKRVGPRA